MPRTGAGMKNPDFRPVGILLGDELGDLALHRNITTRHKRRTGDCVLEDRRITALVKARLRPIRVVHMHDMHGNYSTYLPRVRQE